MTRRRLVLIVNPVSGGGRSAGDLPSLARDIEALGPEVVATEVTTSLDHAIELTRDAISQDCVAVAIGGDGLVSAVAGAVAEADGLMGIVPSGRGNDFARMLGIRNRSHALQALSGAEQRVDLGWVNGKYFTCIASVGFDSNVMETAQRTRIVSGAFVYPYAAMKALTKWRPAEFSITTDGADKSVVGYSVAVANAGYYGGGMWLAPQADVTDGWLDVVTVAKINRVRFLRQALKVYKGTHLTNPEVNTWRTRRAEINADRPFVVFADGEPVCELPATIEVRPGALKVLLPTH